METYRIGGTILDPLNDFEPSAGVRWARHPIPFAPDYYPAPGEDSPDFPEYRDAMVEYADILNGIGRGEALIVDEAARFIPSGAKRTNALLQWADTARNRGSKFVFAEKRPVRLAALTVDLATHLAFRPWRSASARRWLADAGADVDDLPILPMLAPSLDNPWYLLRIGGDVEQVTAREILAGFIDESNFSS